MATRRSHRHYPPNTAPTYPGQRPVHGVMPPSLTPPQRRGTNDCMKIHVVDPRGRERKIEDQEDPRGRGYKYTVRQGPDDGQKSSPSEAYLQVPLPTQKEVAAGIAGGKMDPATGHYVGRHSPYKPPNRGAVVDLSLPGPSRARTTSNRRDPETIGGFWSSSGGPRAWATSTPARNKNKPLPALPSCLQRNGFDMKEIKSWREGKQEELRDIMHRVREADEVFRRKNPTPITVSKTPGRFPLRNEEHWDVTMLTPEEQQDKYDSMLVTPTVHETTLVESLERKSDAPRSRLGGRSMSGLIKECVQSLEEHKELFLLERDVVGMCTEMQVVLHDAKRWVKRRKEHRRRVERIMDEEVIAVVWMLKSLYWFLEGETSRRRLVRGLAEHGLELEVVIKGRPGRGK